jgi:DNA-binding transcriptional ArsR family regulator
VTGPGEPIGAPITEESMNNEHRTPASVQKEEDKARRRATMRPHPSRDKIVDAMRVYGRPLSPTQLSKIIGQPLGATAYHVRALFSAGVVDLADNGRVWRAAERFYVLVENSGRGVPLSGLAEQLLLLTGATTVPAADGGYPSPAVVDEQALFELTEIINTITPEVRGLAAASTKRAGAA